VSEPWRAAGAASSGPTTTWVAQALVVTLPRELDDATITALRTDVMDRVRRAGTRALVFEASGLDMIDAAEFADLAAVARAATWLGVRPMLVGLSAGIVGYLAGTDVDTADFEPFRTLEDALATLAAVGPHTGRRS
jgi:anti-anti-sigma regulatory factor